MTREICELNATGQIFASKISSDWSLIVTFSFVASLLFSYSPSARSFRGHPRVNSENTWWFWSQVNQASRSKRGFVRLQKALKLNFRLDVWDYIFNLVAPSCFCWTCDSNTDISQSRDSVIDHSLTIQAMMQDRLHSHNDRIWPRRRGKKNCWG